MINLNNLEDSETENVINFIKEYPPPPNSPANCKIDRSQLKKIHTIPNKKIKKQIQETLDKLKNKK